MADSYCVNVKQLVKPLKRRCNTPKFPFLLLTALAFLPLSTTFSPVFSRASIPLAPGARQSSARLCPAAGSARWAMASDTSDDDWRQFRAKLVAKEQGAEPSAAGDWAYNSGNLVEQGSLLMGGTELDFGFGLRQQYFHKCVLLICAHTVGDFTRGVIVNRPTNRRTARGWRLWYGGDVQGLMAQDHMQHISCLHRSTNEALLAVSETVIKGVYMCSLQNAYTHADLGNALEQDFWALVGYAGWGPGQLQMEIDDRSSWFVAAASAPLLNELIVEAADAATADAGIEQWHSLMGKIGLQNKADAASRSFEDKMLREWVREHVSKDPVLLQSEAVNALAKAAARRGRNAQGIAAGDVLRTTSSHPYILNKQFLHKALLLVIQDTEDMTIAVILNRPTQNQVNGVTRQAAVKGDETEDKRCIFFGGEYDSGSNRSPLSRDTTLRAASLAQEPPRATRITPEPSSRAESSPKTTFFHIVLG